METLIYLVILFLNVLLYFYYHKLPTFLKAYDSPINKIKQHKHPIPLSGGLSVCITLIFVLLIEDSNSFHNLLLIICLLLIYIVGFFDDLHLLSPIKRIIFLSSILLIFINLNSFYIIKEIKIYNLIIDINIILGLLLTLFSFIAVLNAFNFIDGIDGLSSTLFISIFSLCLFLENEIDISIIILIFSIFIYIFFNLSKKSFLGDSGIYILSSFLFFFLLTKYQLDDLSLRQIILILSFPGVDLISVSILRIKNKKKFYLGDRNHFHHFLFDCYGLKKAIFSIMLFFWVPNIFFNYLDMRDRKSVV